MLFSKCTSERVTWHPNQTESQKNGLSLQINQREILPLFLLRNVVFILHEKTIKQAQINLSPSSFVSIYIQYCLQLALIVWLSLTAYNVHDDCNGFSCFSCSDFTRKLEASVSNKKFTKELAHTESDLFGSCWVLNFPFSFLYLPSPSFSVQKNTR